MEQSRIQMIQLDAMMKALPSFLLKSILKSLTPVTIVDLMSAFTAAVFIGSLGVIIAGIYFTTVFLINHWDMISFFLLLLIIIRVYRGRYRQTLLHQD
jgi:hypothetical protein